MSLATAPAAAVPTRWSVLLRALAPVLRAVAFYLTAVLVAVGWMATFPLLIAIRLLSSLHADAAIVAGRPAWAPGVEVAVSGVGGVR
jgi:hypothetical protein